MKTVNRHPKAPKMLRQMIIRLPNSVDIEEILATPSLVQTGEEPTLDLPDDLRRAMFQYITVLQGSEVYLSKKLIIIMSYIAKPELTDLFDKHSLDWTVLTTEGEPLIQTQILKFMSDIVIYDEEGEVIGTEPVLDVEGKLSIVAGHSWG